MRALGVLGALSLAAAVPTASQASVTAPVLPDFELPPSARGNGPRCRLGNKGAGPSAAEKKRRRKLARQSQRRNQGRS